MPTAGWIPCTPVSSVTVDNNGTRTTPLVVPLVGNDNSGPPCRVSVDGYGCQESKFPQYLATKSRSTSNSTQYVAISESLGTKIWSELEKDLKTNRSLDLCGSTFNPRGAARRLARPHRRGTSMALRRGVRGTDARPAQRGQNLGLRGWRAELVRRRRCARGISISRFRARECADSHAVRIHAGRHPQDGPRRQRSQRRSAGVALRGCATDAPPGRPGAAG